MKIKHVLLERGEVIQKGDSYYKEGCACWYPVWKIWIGHKVGESWIEYGCIRRPACNVSMNDWRNMP